MHLSNPSDRAKFVSTQKAEYRHLEWGRNSLLKLDEIDKLTSIGFEFNGPGLI